MTDATRSSATITIPTFKFDGRSFSYLTSSLAPFIYLAAIARRGDALAVELLTSSFVEIRDVDGKLYWPMETSEVRP